MAQLGPRRKEPGHPHTAGQRTLLASGTSGSCSHTTVELGGEGRGEGEGEGEGEGRRREGRNSTSSVIMDSRQYHQQRHILGS